MLSRAIDGFLFFDDDTGGRAVAPVTFAVLADDPSGAIRTTSILGLDVLLLGRLTLDRQNVLLDLPVVTPTR